MFNHFSDVVADLIASYPVLQPVRESVIAAFECIKTSYEDEGTLFVAGNGGSAADAEHIAGELLKGFLSRRPLGETSRRQLIEQDADMGAYLATYLQQGLPCVALTGHPALMSAVTNDLNGDMGFAQQLNALASNQDIFLGISTSGNARNVCLASLVARMKGMTVVSLTGENGGKLADLADVAIKVPVTVTHKIQELHLPVYHALCAMLEVYFFPGS